MTMGKSPRKSPRKSPSKSLRKCLNGRVSMKGGRCLSNSSKSKKSDKKCALRSPRKCVSPKGLRHVYSPRKHSPRKHSPRKHSPRKKSPSQSKALALGEKWGQFLGAALAKKNG